MRSNCVYLAAIAVMATGMVFAQSSSPSAMDSQGGSSTESAQPNKSGHTDASGDLPASKEAEAQSGKNTQATPDSEMPGSTGMAKTPDQGRTPKGGTPATGMHSGQKGSADNSDALPAVDPTSAPPDNKKN